MSNKTQQHGKPDDSRSSEQQSGQESSDDKASAAAAKKGAQTTVSEERPAISRGKPDEEIDVVVTDFGSVSFKGGPHKAGKRLRMTRREAQLRNAWGPYLKQV